MDIGKISLVGEAWGEEEDILKFPFVGSAGRELARLCQDASILPRTKVPYLPRDMRNFWLDHSNRLSLHNVFNLRPERNEIETLCVPKSLDTSGLPPIRAGKYIRGEYVGELQRLADELKRASPNIVVALGNVPSWALLRSTGISKFRGTITTETLTGSGLKCLPTFHPAAVLRQWDIRPTTVFDLAKGGRESSFPDVRRPDRTIFIEPTLGDIAWFYANHIADCALLSFDIETKADQITCIGFAPSASLALVIPFVDPRKPLGNYWPSLHEELEAWKLVRAILAEPMPKLTQNGVYDIQFLWRHYGIPTRNAAHDTMLLHHALQPESKKGLGYLGSIYTNEASWKLMRTETLKRDE